MLEPARKEVPPLPKPVIIPSFNEKTGVLTLIVRFRQEKPENPEELIKQGFYINGPYFQKDKAFLQFKRNKKIQVIIDPEPDEFVYYMPEERIEDLKKRVITPANFVESDTLPKLTYSIVPKRDQDTDIDMEELDEMLAEEQGASVPLMSEQVGVENPVETGRLQIELPNTNPQGTTHIDLKSREPLLGLTKSRTDPRPVNLAPLHTIFTGMTRESGKTTAMEGTFSRWEGKKILVFVCKSGEESFLKYHKVAPYMRERADWEYVQSLIEASLHEKNRADRTELITICEQAESLEQVYERIVTVLNEQKYETETERRVFIRLEAYLKRVIPELRRHNFVQRLNLKEGINVMNLQQFKPDMQSMIIGATSEEVMNPEAKWRDVVIAVPEAWEIVPNQRGSPARIQMEALARKGAALGNLAVLDSQDLAGIHVPIRKEIGNYVLGKQIEENEVDRTISVMPMVNGKPANFSAAIQTLGLGEFYSVIHSKIQKVFAIPAWMRFEDAVDCAADKTGMLAWKLAQRHAKGTYP